MTEIDSSKIINAALQKIDKQKLCAELKIRETDIVNYLIRLYTNIKVEIFSHIYVFPITGS